MTKLHIITTSLITLLITFTLLIVPLAITNAASDALCNGVNLEVPTGGVAADCTTPTGDESAASTVNKTVALVINVFSWIVGVISVIMVIFGGFRYVTSGGDAGKVTSAKNTILYAIVGLIIVALAQVIVQFVLELV